ncbi:transcriptional regulator [Nonomuraea aridisoli]|uniref:Transcriptional regulator n=1 Tax=Nonomuraea aridisoli TaxID=2070368 RepID=A0A2W2DMN0_9ACTN|nr:transcriptional regulator [Nonomuraea aridisoli]
MAVYAYRCPHCCEVEVAFPIGTAPAAVPCPGCGAPSARTFSAPMLTRTPAALSARLRRAERSASEPEVVTSVPRCRAPGPVADHPAARRLPRP